MERMEKTKVLIVGAGPAGSTCGLLLRKRGIDCMLVDRATFPRDKICGGGLTPRSYHLLEELLPTFHYDYNNVHELKLLMEGEPVFNLHMNSELRIVKRRQFDAQLLEEYRNSGGHFTCDALTSIEEHDRQVIATFRSGRQVSCDYLIGADGANSRVRKYLCPETNRGFLFLEQYGPKSPDNAIVINLSANYDRGYYYCFPNETYDVQGFCDYNTTMEIFRKVLTTMGCPEEKAKGAFIPLDIDYPLHEHIILIGDAGGFANRLTFEGLYYAFLTASHAAEAIDTGQPFAEVSRQVFDNKRKEERLTRLFYSRSGLKLFRFLCKRLPGVVRWSYNKATN